MALHEARLLRAPRCRISDHTSKTTQRSDAMTTFRTTDSTVTSKVRLDLEEDVLVVTIDQAPFNLLSVLARRELLAAIGQAQTDERVNAIVLTGAGGDFSVGVKFHDMGSDEDLPHLRDICNAVESSTKPVVAAIEGTAFGGGLEVAIAAHARIASSTSKLGLPDVRIGLLPMAGGSQRLPRLIGLSSTLDVMLSGISLTGQQAFELGLVEVVTEPGKALRVAIDRMRKAWVGDTPLRKTRDLPVAEGAAWSERRAIAAARAATAKDSPNALSPHLIVCAVEASLDLPFDAAVDFERALFLRCLASPQHHGLQHAAVSERNAKSLRRAEANSKPRDLKHVGVIGGGTMGAGISISLLEAGFDVTMIERTSDAASAGRTRVEKIFEDMVSKRRRSAPESEAALKRLVVGSTYSELGMADLVIESAFEDFQVKAGIFKQLDQICKPGAILATNTSYLDVDQLGRLTSRPADVIGLHFFSPAHIMKLLEVVVPTMASAEVVATAFALGERLGKISVRAGVCDGFIGNRILARYREAADHMLEDGASPYQIDHAARSFGFAMGPYEVLDLAGGDIAWATRKRRAMTRDPKARYVSIPDRLCERGWFGQKSGRGWYRYDPSVRGGLEDSEVMQLVREGREAAGQTPRAFAAEEIVSRLMSAMVNEGANVLEEEIAERPSDVDVTLLHGFGFPKFRGGPLKYADQVGIHKVLADVLRFAQQDPVFWKPSPLLTALAKSNRNFQSLNN